MTEYPEMDVAAQGYAPEWSDGTEVMRAESGRAWLYREYDEEQVELTITHPALTSDQERSLRDFYRDHKSEHVRFNDPRSGDVYLVQMAGPPRIARMQGGMLADVQMTLLGVRE